ncbi:inositol monophosphatase family protein [Paracoccus zhejiangensis]|uniref:Inositol-1-monophosphatase n=1 Tax=Paracoccus zhejiangensis TaxID=1077935 RepID=A0A2H5EYL0_9RHOB|nr:inositol monophosphatase [Paracoccus zhejiangensis]AUH64385.1 inositol monophosphatase [Paracoccus zhejiangensis]
MLTEIDLAARLAQVEQIARKAGALALRHFHSRDALEIETKRSLTDMVSIADREVEELIRSELLSAYPEDAMLGEEYGLMPGRSGLTWVVDPIDGTAPFLNGLPGWCVSIGLMDADGPLMGAIFAPVLDEMFLGGRGLGATLNGRAIRVTERFDLTSGLLGLGANDRVPPARLADLHGELAARNIAWVRYGSGALMLAYVAAGRLVGYCEPRMSLWDCLAAYALIEAAGGRVASTADSARHATGFAVLGATRRDYDAIAALTRFDEADWVLPT